MKNANVIKNILKIPLHKNLSSQVPDSLRTLKSCSITFCTQLFGAQNSLKILWPAKVGIDLVPLNVGKGGESRTTFGGLNG